MTTVKENRSRAWLAGIAAFVFILFAFGHQTDINQDLQVKIDQLQSSVDQNSDDILAIRTHQQVAPMPPVYNDPTMMPPYYEDPMMPTYTACDSLNDELTYLNSMNVPEGLIVIGGDCQTTDMYSGIWPHYGYPGNPGDAWTYQAPENVDYDVYGTADIPLDTSVVPSGQHPFYPKAATIEDMVPGTLVCRMVGDVSQGVFVVTSTGAYLTNGMFGGRGYGTTSSPMMYWTDGSSYPSDLMYDGVIPSFDGTWSTNWLKVASETGGC